MTAVYFTFALAFLSVVLGFVALLVQKRYLDPANVPLGLIPRRSGTCHSKGM
jgi:hypothetical protein